MTFLQINNGVVVNSIILNDESLLSAFSVGFQYFIRVDVISPTPGIGWSYDGANFTPPIPTPIVNLWHG